MTIFDIANHIAKTPLSAMKLQKLCYYAKAWYLVWDEEELFLENFEAWNNGAICPELYERHKGVFKVTQDLFPEAQPLSKEQKETVNEVIRFYGKYNTQQLVGINRQEQPWIEAREGVQKYEQSHNIITSASMDEYYSGIMA